MPNADSGLHLNSSPNWGSNIGPFMTGEVRCSMIHVRRDHGGGGGGSRRGNCPPPPPPPDFSFLFFCLLVSSEVSHVRMIFFFSGQDAERLFRKAFSRHFATPRGTPQASPGMTHLQNILGKGGLEKKEAPFNVK